MTNGMLSVDEALARLLAGARTVSEVETVPTLAATGRVIARAQASTLNVPPLDNTSMDGYAVRAADCAAGSARLRIAQRIPAGAVGKPVKPRPQPGEWIRRAGEDIRAGATILEAGTRLRAQEIGLAASVGLASLPVYRKVKAALFPPGNELVMPGEPLPEGAIYNSNRFTLTGLLPMLGCDAG